MRRGKGMRSVTDASRLSGGDRLHRDSLGTGDDMAKQRQPQTTYDRGVRDGFNAADPTSELEDYLNGYRAGAERRQAKHALLDIACENGRRAVALGRTGPTSTPTSVPSC